jgi:hypothetical protein
MKIASVKPEDLVHCEHLGRRFWARVEGREGRRLAITPVSRNINYHRATSREVLAHYAHRPRTAGRVSIRSIRPGDIVAYDRDGAKVHASVLARHRGRLQVAPIGPGASPGEVRTREVIDHYARRGGVRPKALAS